MGKVILKKEDEERLVVALMQDKKIIDMYETYIVKSIPFEKWVRQTTKRLLDGSNKEVKCPYSK
jgi:hypothetical protein